MTFLGEEERNNQTAWGDEKRIEKEIKIDSFEFKLSK